MNEINRVIAQYQMHAARLQLRHENPRPGRKRPPLTGLAYLYDAIDALERIFHEDLASVPNR